MAAGVSRRTVLRAIGGTAVAAAAGSILEACNLIGAAPTPRNGHLTLGSNASDPAPKQALQAVVDAFTAAQGTSVSVNTVDHASFQNQISTYLQGTPDDVFTWFAGDRMRFFARQGLVLELSAVWASIGSHYGDGVRQASSLLDTPFFVPFYDYPWVVLYRRSLWQQHGYVEPKTWADLLALCRRMQTDGLIPIAFGDKDGWPAMGWFDMLDLRLNGYDFHIALLSGDAQWTDGRVVAVFERWREVLPFLQPAALGRTWQEAAQALVNGQAGLMYIGTFAGEQATADQRSDLAMATFPMLGTAYDAERAIEAPINGFMAKPHPADPAAAEQFLAFVGSARAQELFVAQNPNYVAVALDANQSGYTPFQKQMAAIMANAGRTAQFFDRDTRPDFATTTGMQAFFQDFLANPDADLGPLLARIQAFWGSLG
jgi:multiple sugar transport system substrate-binding protein